MSKRKGFKNTMNFLNKLLKRKYLENLDRFGQLGVERLAAATPVDTGKTAASWGYKIQVDDKRTKITWTNSNVNDGACVAILIQYGHATRNGSWVEGIDYVNPAMRPMFEQIANDVWKEVVG